MGQRSKVARNYARTAQDPPHMTCKQAGCPSNRKGERVRLVWAGADICGLVLDRFRLVLLARDAENGFAVRALDHL